MTIEPKRSCRVCGKVRPGGRPVCSTCYARDSTTWRECSSCGELRRVAARSAAGLPVCPGCYRRPRERCSSCDTLAAVHARVAGNPVCDHCYRSARRPCGGCGRTRRIALRATRTSPDLCAACHWAPTATCTRCGATAIATGVTTGQAICFGCVAVAKLDAIITRPAGDRDERLAPLLDLFARVDQPRTLLNWLDRKATADRPTRGVDLLARFTTGSLELTHEALDGLDATPSLTHLRGLLVAAGILPDRDPHVASLEAAIDRALARIEHNDDRRLLTSFARWEVLHKLRRRHARAGAITPSSAKNAATTVSEAARFLHALRDQDIELADATQAHVDQWLAGGAHARRNVNTFLRWADRQHITAALSIPLLRREIAPRSLDQDQRWHIARRLLSDTSIASGDRVAGILVVLYAQPLTRIATLQANHVDDDGNDLHMTLGTTSVLIPPPVADLVRALPDRRQLGTSGHSANAHQWLFPGRNAGHHLHVETIRTRLATLGIRARDTRTAALLQLAAELPPTVIADLLGIHPNTAVKWAKAAGGDWSRYAASRATQTPFKHD